MPNLPLMWQKWERILKDDGLAIFTAQQPFASELIMSRKGMFKCDWIWMKEKTSDLKDELRQLLKEKGLI